MYILNQFVHALYTRHLLIFKSHNKFYEDISIGKGLSSEEMFTFSGIVEIQGQAECVAEKKCFRRNKKQVKI